MEQSELLRYTVGVLERIAGVLKVSGAHLDRSYIAEWSDRMGTSEIGRRS